LEFSAFNTANSAFGIDVSNKNKNNMGISAEVHRVTFLSTVSNWLVFVKLGHPKNTKKNRLPRTKTKSKLNQQIVPI